ncbi:MAG: hypothetical protein HOE30_02005 [Deltaproteobacteria bacterium]|jgi:hypothetical protein|uniref:hypothetical protein n=1 Tax=Desulfobacula sp. TaxID=2593537 RepID=UPI002AE9C63E|nr:hypothetical protein [Deltaproteobacteria bacterium]MBT7632192.1 hypothetical protein [Desulfobacula sp.]MBT4087245.1 hypothetical protein [Deltaproteobacteria bacterium]MBT4264887.1 hypothetical protein [Deltaproteobacteria bacterium]MBT4640027.1 hypothetical protein [Deltaproteobacteria bacterium]
MFKDSELASSTFEHLFEKTNRYFDQHPVISKELISAKEEYFTITGKIGESDNEFGNRMNAFLLWFLFDFRLASTQTTPIDHYLAHLKDTKTGGDLTILRSQKDHVHSLFFFVKEKQDMVIIKDIFTGLKYNISDSRILIGHDKNALFETRLFEIDGTHYFANFFIHHPINVRKGIKRRLKQIKKNKESLKPFLMKLHAYQTKWRRYRNIDIKSIYHFDKSLPEAK